MLSTRRPSLTWSSTRVSFLPENTEPSLNNSANNAETNEQQDNGITVTPNDLRLTPSGSSLIFGNSSSIRDSTRRLVYLDQQYCASMPTILNPTEESQLELFNQDGKIKKCM